MGKFRVKKLNNSGFTLIELLAVVVIFAIILGIVSVPVLNSVNNTRRITLHSTARQAATNLNNWIMEDAIVVNDSERKLGNEFMNKTMSGSWICLSNDLMVNNDGKSISLISALGLNSSDVLLGGTFNKESKDNAGVAVLDPTCSAIRYNENTSGYEVLLVAAINGKYYVNSDKVHFAYSSANAVNESISD